MLDTDYFFYLAFENSLCDDYVTEKLFDALERTVIPVVFGGADYSRILPPHSYVDANRFMSVEGLAQYMKLVVAARSLKGPARAVYPIHPYHSPLDRIFW